MSVLIMTEAISTPDNVVGFTTVPVSEVCEKSEDEIMKHKKTNEALLVEVRFKKGINKKLNLKVYTKEQKKI
ncbi:hypothetical protein MASR2M69_04230 [Bacteroidota bacterium]